MNKKEQSITLAVLTFGFYQTIKALAEHLKAVGKVTIPRHELYPELEKSLEDQSDAL